jgi:hypothetical protein
MQHEHAFNPETQVCVCGMTGMQIADHDDERTILVRKVVRQEIDRDRAERRKRRPAS